VIGYSSGVGERIVDRPGLATPGEDAAWSALRERITINLRPIGGPAAIGFLGLAAASLVMAGLQVGWVAADQGRQVALVLIGFVFPAQFVAGIFSFLARDGVAATAMSTLSLTWLVTGLVTAGAKPGSTSAALGLFLVFSAAAMALTALTAALSKLVPAVVFLVASLRFVTTGVYHLGAGEGWKVGSAVVGLVLFLLAMYAAWATELEEALGRPLLPLGRRNKGRVAVTGSLLEQVKEITTEPGVREQL
jgi:succinate-acetate transporter protein